MWMWMLLAAGPLTGVMSGPVLRALPEPPEELRDGKPPYAELATRRFALAVACCSMAACAVLIATLSPQAWPLWFPLATLGVLLVSIDAVTTWLPLVLTRALWLATGAGATLHLWLVPAPERGALMLRLMLGAAAVGGFFWGFWRLSGGLGFGDVRLAPVLGAVLASVSWPAVIAGLLLGTILGAALGLIRQLRKRAGPFPYGPALVVGTFLGAALAG